MRYLFDASSIYRLVAAGSADRLVQAYTCSFARYELCNILATEARVRKTIDSTQQKRLLSSIVAALNLMWPVALKGDEERVMGVAMDIGLSFYDAAYAYAAKKASATLVTEDARLARLANKYVAVTDAGKVA